jgi:O-acetyl-ADP-ribose deacetylase (regulator of RNase III)
MITVKEILTHIKIIQGDITLLDVDAIVNAANTSLLGGGGVDGAIHRKAGPRLLDECRKFGGCNPGEARITAGYNLKSKHVIHTPGPIYRNGKNGEDAILRNSYLNSMKLAMDYKLKSIAFPAISTGVYGYPKPEACKIAVDTVINFMIENNFIIEIIFALFDSDNYSNYIKYTGEKNGIS